MAYLKARPVLLTGNMFRGGKTIIATTAETVDELRESIISDASTGLNRSELAKYVISQPGGVPVRIPLFTANANCPDENCARFDEVISIIRSNPRQGYEYIQGFSISEPVKAYESGALFTNISEAISYIESKGLTKAFYDEFGKVPQAESLSNLNKFITMSEMVSARKPQLSGYKEELTSDETKNIVLQLVNKVGKLEKEIEKLRGNNNKPSEEFDYNAAYNL